MHAGASFAQTEALVPPAQPPLGLRGELLAQAGGVENASGAPSAGGGLRPPAAPEPTQEPDAPWRIPPIRWGGTVTTDARIYKVGDDKPRFQQLEYATLRAASYVYQPWFAQIGGSLGLLTAYERGGGGDDDRATKSRSTAVTARTTRRTRRCDMKSPTEAGV